MFKISGNSMFPTLCHNSFITTKKIGNNDYKKGEIICFPTYEKIIVHRIIYISKNFVVTRGDFSSSVDLPIYKNLIIGKVTSVLNDKNKFFFNFSLKTPHISLLFFNILNPLVKLYSLFDELVNKWYYK
jgi:signal peptidase I